MEQLQKYFFQCFNIINLKCEFGFLAGALPFVGPTMAAAGNIIGGERANRSNERIANQATASNASQAAQQMKFQERMSNTAHQRQVTDMREAGLNPMLAAQMGGSSSPTGAAGSAQMATMQNTIGDSLQSAVSSAIEMQRLKKEIKAVDSQIEVNKTLSDKQKADTNYVNTQEEIAKKEVPLANAKEQLTKELVKPVLNSASSMKEGISNTKNWLQKFGEYRKENLRIREMKKTLESRDELNRRNRQSKELQKRIKSR